MKMLMMIGAISGFGLGLGIGFLRHADWPTTLWRACASAALLGVMVRWWGRVWQRNLRTALRERRVAESAARQRAQTPTPAKS